MGKNTMPDIFCIYPNQGGFYVGFEERAARILLKMMDAFGIKEVTAGQVGRLFDKSPQKGSGICNAASLVSTRRRGVAYYSQNKE